MMLLSSGPTMLLDMHMKKTAPNITAVKNVDLFLVDIHMSDLLGCVTKTPHYNTTEYDNSQFN